MAMQMLDTKLIIETRCWCARARPLQPHPPVERWFWRLDTSSDWWDWLVMERWDDQQWLHDFRMWKATFLELCAWLASALCQCDTHLQPAMPLETWVTFAIWKLATPDSYWSVGNQFSMGKSTVGALLMEVVRAINTFLLHRVIRLGDPDPIVAGFATLKSPNCGGAIDGTHTPVRAPHRLATQYINRKGYFSMALQVLVDYRGRFTDVSVGWLGRATLLPPA
ncbi:uncharacterized protein LOC142819439 [Pelodiscus sinensis]|uniref:uncharacterized protein LOC142819439 n=1 Tax=Pelodiscus sinensis TaxID=13735 RepID=UPI003F6D8D9C